MENGNGASRAVPDVADFEAELRAMSERDIRRLGHEWRFSHEDYPGREDLECALAEEILRMAKANAREKLRIFFG